MMPSLEALESFERLDAIERELRISLPPDSLVGDAVDLDQWAELIESAIVVAARSKTPTYLRRRWPASFITFMVWQSLRKYRDATFWPNVTVVEFRVGQVVGPQFEQALRDLKLPTFDDLEVLEGIKKQSRGRYLRRMHLHGGLPNESIDNVVELMRASLNAGLRTADEMVAEWITLDLSALLHSKGAERLLRYSGDFGTRVVAELLVLWRDANQGGSLASSGAPPLLVHAIQRALATQEPIAIRRGVRVSIDPRSRRGPIITVPKGRSVEWFVNGRLAGVSSMQVEQRFHLRPPPVPEPGDAMGWRIVTAEADGEETARFVASFGDDECVAVFRHSGRIHRRGSTLTGFAAHVLGPNQMQVTGEVDRVELEGEWSRFDLVTVDLRRIRRLEVSIPGTDSIIVEVDAALHPRLGGDVVEGIFSADGAPVFGESVWLSFDGHLPNSSEVAVGIGSCGGAIPLVCLDRLPERDGAFDLGPLLTRDGKLMLRVDAGVPNDLSLVRFETLRVQRPGMARSDHDLAVGLSYEGEAIGFFDKVTALPTTSRLPLNVITDSGAVELQVQLNRVLWGININHSAPEVSGDQFVLRADDLAAASLVVHAENPLPRVAIVSSHLAQVADLQRKRGDFESGSLALARFADTARSSRDTRLRVELRPVDGSTPFTIGTVESRFEPRSLEVEGERDLGVLRVTATWEEDLEWPLRVVRVWGSDGIVLVEEPVPAGERGALLELPDPGCRVLVEVSTSSLWGTPTKPEVGRSCIALDTAVDGAGELREAVLGEDRRYIPRIGLLDQVVPTIADLSQELFPIAGTLAQRQILTRILLKDPWRTIRVISELSNRIGRGDGAGGGHEIDRLVLGLLPFLVGRSLGRHGGGRQKELETLWQNSPLAAMCLDRPGDDLALSRWYRHVGWNVAARGWVSRWVGEIPGTDDVAHDRVPYDRVDVWLVRRSGEVRTGASFAALFERRGRARSATVRFKPMVYDHRHDEYKAQASPILEKDFLLSSGIAEDEIYVEHNGWPISRSSVEACRIEVPGTAQVDVDVSLPRSDQMHLSISVGALDPSEAPERYLRRRFWERVIEELRSADRKQVDAWRSSVRRLPPARPHSGFGSEVSAKILEIPDASPQNDLLADVIRLAHRYLIQPRESELEDLAQLIAELHGFAPNSTRGAVALVLANHYSGLIETPRAAS